MNYQVWTKGEFGEEYKKVECGDLAAAKREIDEAVRKGAEPILTVEVPYSLAIKVDEPGAEKPKRKQTLMEAAKQLEEASKSEANQGETGPGESPRAEGEGEI